ncbi:hypothetical protein K1719_003533 [Acacia pycnantha]|nr:hypothetical protein K1719_003533 [Acacia pycnantha]
MLIKSGASQAACEEALMEASLMDRPTFAEILMESNMIRSHVAVHALVSASCRGFTQIVHVLLKVLEEELVKICDTIAKSITEVPTKLSGPGGMNKVTIEEELGKSCYNASVFTAKLEDKPSGHHVGDESNAETNISILKCSLIKGVDSNMVSEEKAHAINLVCVTSGREGEELPIVNGVTISGVEKKRDNGTSSSEPMISTKENGSPVKNGTHKKRG